MAYEVFPEVSAKADAILLLREYLLCRDGTQPCPQTNLKGCIFWIQSCWNVEPRNMEYVFFGFSIGGFVLDILFTYKKEWPDVGNRLQKKRGSDDGDVVVVVVFSPPTVFGKESLVVAFPVCWIVGMMSIGNRYNRGITWSQRSHSPFPLQGGRTDIFPTFQQERFAEIART